MHSFTSIYAIQKMKEIYITDKTIRENSLAKGVYESCQFDSCDFSTRDFSGFHFIDSTFSNCNLSMVKLDETVFRDVVFTGSKMLGLHFEQCSQFGLSFKFTSCKLNHSSFFGLKMKKILFKECELFEADFTEADLTEALFDHCNLERTVFDRTILEKADFRTAFHYTIDPENNRIRRARFSLTGVCGLLDKYGIQVEK